MNDDKKIVEVNDEGLELVQAGLLLPAIQSAREASNTGETSGNTVYVGGASGGVWKTTN